MRFLVTAGPTREHLDPVRFLSNPSTGKMGFAVAQRAAERGHSVTLVTGVVALPTPEGVERVEVVSALEMLAAVERYLPLCDILVMSAAVADWRPAQVSRVKLKKSNMQPIIELTPNPDIFKTVLPMKGQRVFVGFAAETGSPILEAERKLREKGLDMIVANDVSEHDAGFAVDTNRVTLLFKDGAPQPLPLQSKLEVAKEIVAWGERLCQSYRK